VGVSQSRGVWVLVGASTHIQSAKAHVSAVSAGAEYVASAVYHGLLDGLMGADAACRDATGDAVGCDLSKVRGSVFTQMVHRGASRRGT